MNAQLNEQKFHMLKQVEAAGAHLLFFIVPEDESEDYKDSVVNNNDNNNSTSDIPADYKNSEMVLCCC